MTRDSKPDLLRRFYIPVRGLFVSLLAIAVLTGVDSRGLSAPPSSPSTEIAVRPVSDGISDSEATQQRLFDAVRYLASDELEGRGVGTDGLDKAAEFIAAHFEQVGLKTDLYNGEPFDHFSRTRRIALGSTNHAQLASSDGTELKLGFREDFLPLSLSASRSFSLPLVFAGYGITAPDLGYDDYAQVDVQGKAVVLFRHEPRQDDPRSPFNGTEYSEHAYFARKITNAVEHGAAAVILCTGVVHLQRALRDAGTEPSADALDAADTLLEFKVRSKLGDRRIPVVHCKRKVLDPLVQSSLGKSLAELELLIDERLGPQSAALADWKIEGEVSVLEQGRTLKNVVGLLEGDGSVPNETVVIGAHYDHLGLGGWGSLAWGTDDQIHNGADDNASGTSVLLEVARRLAGGEKLRRDVLFIAFTAEEMGLVGSEHYVRDPLIPIDHTIAMLNLDMVGRLREDRLTVGGTGTAAEFDPLVERFSRKYDFRLSKDASGYGPSDHASFYGLGVPVLHFFTGLHSDYHRPSDDFDTLNLDGMERITLMVCDSLLEIANADERPIRQSPLRSLLADEPTRPRRIMPQGPWLGVATNDDDDGEGFAISRIIEGSPAEKAGLNVEDVILRFNERSIETAADLIAAVGEQQSGETITLAVRRGRVEIEVEVTLGNGL